MNPLLLVLVASWRVALGDALIERIRTAELEHVAVEAAVVPGGLDVSCRVRARIIRPGPVRFFLSSACDGVTAAREDGSPLPAALGDGGLGAVARMAGAPEGSIPVLLTVGTGRAAGETVAFTLRYRWRPPPGGLPHAGPRVVETHPSGFWLPTMEGQRFTATVSVDSPWPVVATGTRAPDAGGRAVFRTAAAVPVVCLVAGDFTIAEARHDGRVLELWMPRGDDAPPIDAPALLADTARVLALLEEWFGPAVPPTFRILVQPRARPLPSYCAGDFLVLHRAALPGALDRTRWLSLLAHECAHVWWGHRVGMPVLGRGGTWLREGLAQWTGHAAARALGAADPFRRDVAWYLGTLDLRRDRRGLLFANEPTLIDATYLDPPAVAYLRGGLVFRLIEHRLGGGALRGNLRALARAADGREVAAAEFLARVGGGGLARYYAETTALPDLRVTDVRFEGARVRAVVRCDDPRWPGGTVPVAVRGEAGEQVVPVAVRDGIGTLDVTAPWPVAAIEVDPERLWLDPIRSNGVASAR